MAAEAQFVIQTNNGAITIVNYFDSGNSSVVIPNTTNGLPVKAVAANAFYQVDNMTSLTFGTNVGTIGTNAIFQCKNLASVTLPNSVTNFGLGPFYDCEALTAFTTTFSNAYYVVTNGTIMNRVLTALVQYPAGVSGSYVLPASVTNVGEALIGNSLSSMTVDLASTFFTATNGVLFSKNHAVLYYYPGELAGSYTVPTNTTIIASGAFEYSRGLTSVAIGTNVTSIQYAAFYDCQNLLAINVNSTNQFYFSTNGVLYDKTKTMLVQYPAGLGGNYTILSTVTNIGDGAFGDAFGLNSVVIPNSVSYIGFEAFYACFKLSAVSLGSGVGTIGPSAFFLCTNLSQISIPSSVTNIGSYAFANCYVLDYACFQGKPPTDGGNIFIYDWSLPEILYVNGNTGWGSSYDSLPTVTCTACAGLLSNIPTLSVIHSGTNVVVRWLTNYQNFTLEYATNLAGRPIVWKTNMPAAVIASTNYVSTNSATGLSRFYRLIQ